MSDWAKYEGGTDKDHWIDLEWKDFPESYAVYRAGVKWDGCIHLCQYSNNEDPDDEKSDPDYMHICDIDEMIDILTKLKAKAIEHFKDWPL